MFLLRQLQKSPEARTFIINGLSNFYRAGIFPAMYEVGMDEAETRYSGNEIEVSALRAAFLQGFTAAITVLANFRDFLDEEERGTV